jgi:hypothetical protein
MEDLGLQDAHGIFEKLLLAAGGSRTMSVGNSALDQPVRGISCFV